jgi:outer membrane beta-barrel protein
MPKTKRIQFFGGLATMANDPWFYGICFSGKIGFGFTETWGLEATFGSNSTSQKDTIKDLFDAHGVGASQIVTTSSYLLGDLVWTPVYGKMTLFNQRIVPFDMYFSFGAGSSAIANATTTSATTLHAATGMIFGLTRSLGFRWDLSVNNYSATTIPVGSAAPSAGSFNNVLLTIGASYYIPEVRAR